ncbi:MAG: hypothetical protein IT437_14265 [Phycisphaerales bacterium]|nr:hypothetical protein [Phycisphaerales bacterium]
MKPSSPHNRARRIAIFALVLGVGALAALFWSRLKLVTGIPRTAYAEPGSAVLAASEQAPSPVE